MERLAQGRIAFPRTDKRWHIAPTCPLRGRTNSTGTSTCTARGTSEST